MYVYIYICTHNQFYTYRHILCILYIHIYICILYRYICIYCMYIYIYYMYISPFIPIHRSHVWINSHRIRQGTGIALRLKLHCDPRRRGAAACWV